MSGDLKKMLSDVLAQKGPRAKMTEVAPPGFKNKGIKSHKKHGSPKAITEAVQPKAKASVKGIAKGTKVLYEGREAVTLEEITGPGLVSIRTKNGVILANTAKLRPTSKTLNEAWMMSIPTTFLASSPSEENYDLSAEDLGFEIMGLSEDDESGETDEYEEDDDNGGNIRHDGHTGKKEVDALPTPSDTVGTAYDENKSPKEKAVALATLGGAESAEDPDLGAFTFPGDAPEIPQPEFETGGGNSASITMPHGHAPGIGDHAGGSLTGDGAHAHDASKHKTDDGAHAHEAPKHKPEHHEHDKQDSEKKSEQKEAFTFMAKKKLFAEEDQDPFNKAEGEPKNKATGDDEDPFTNEKPAVKEEDEGFGSDDFGGSDFGGADMGGGEDATGSSEETHEDHPEGGDYDAIRITPAALACVLTTVVGRQADPALLHAIVEALSETCHRLGKDIDEADLQAVADHINGEEMGEAESKMGGEDAAPVPSGDGESTDATDGGEPGKTKLMAGEGEPAEDDTSDEDEDEMFGESTILGESAIYVGLEDLNALTPVSEEDEIATIRRRSGLKYW